jgi:hypothetical protein
LAVRPRDKQELAVHPGSTVEAISSGVKIELKEEKVYTHLDEEKERDDQTWILVIQVMNHMSGSWVAVLNIVRVTSQRLIPCNLALSMDVINGLNQICMNSITSFRIQSSDLHYNFI